MTGLISKVKEALHSNSKSEQPEGTHGHHESRVANAADPRIDSDRDHRAAPGSTVGSTGNYTTSDNYTTSGVGSHGTHTGTTGLNSSTNHGPHDSNLANKADPRVDSDRDHRAGTHTTTGTGLHNTTGTHTSSAAGPHSSNLANKADPRVDSDLDRSRNMGMNTTTGTHNTTGTGLHSTTGAHTGTTGLNSSTNHGPHDSNLANKVDPRVDSDRDHRGATTGIAGGSAGVGGFNSGTSAHTGTHTGTTGFNSSTNHGPHDSNLANKADPRFDSDRDHRAAPGTHNTTGLGSSTHTTGTHGTTGLGSSTHGTSTNHGPHDSNLLNKADPRVDSDRDHRAAPGTHNTTGLGSSTHTTGTHGTTGLGSSTHGTSTNRGPHDSNLANKADPRVDSDRDHRAAPGTHNTTGLGSSTHTSNTHGTTGLTGTHAPGPAPNTAGPHKSDMMNKVDPRVDSDLDGSKTYGGDKTYTRS